MPFPELLPILLPGVDGGTVQVPTLDHAATALARLAQFIREKPNFEGLLNALTAQAQDVETAFQQLLTDRAIDAAFGAQLDVVGRIVGQDREGLDDDTFRLYLKARQLLNRSSGTPAQILELFTVIATAGTGIEFDDQFPAGFVLRLSGVGYTAAQIAVFLKFLRAIKAGGVDAILEWIAGTEATTFMFSTGVGLGFGDIGNPATGGGLAGAAK